LQRSGSGFLANLDREQRVRYYKWWRKYCLLKWLNWIAFAACLACWFMMIGKQPFSSLARIVYKPIFFLGVGTAFWMGQLDCPRCGSNFLSWGVRKYFGDECQNCGLSGMQLSAIAKPRDGYRGGGLR
jgi:hypothetical protein